MSDDLLTRHLATLEAFEAVLDGIPEAAWTWRPAPEEWCAAEIYDHVGRLATMYAFPKLEACLEGRGEAGRSRTAAGWLLLGLPWLAGGFRLRQAFPPEMVPRAVSREEARRMLATLRALARDAAPRVAAADPRLRARHVRLGWLTAQQWFAFAEVHGRHHLKGQLRRLLARPDLPQGLSREG